MTRVVVLDTSVLGLVTSPGGKPNALVCARWFLDLIAGGNAVVVPEIADYELRRELILQGKVSGLARLEAAKAQAFYAPLDTGHSNYAPSRHLLGASPQPGTPHLQRQSPRRRCYPRRSSLPPHPLR